MDQELQKPEQVTNETIAKLIADQDEITWQNIIYELVASEQMNPWDIDIRRLTKGFIKKLKELKELDFRITGKMVLASAFLLKIKSKRLIEEDLRALDSIISNAEEPIDLLEELESLAESELETEKPKLLPRTPQPRQRKVSIFDLVGALEKALEVEARRKPVQQIEQEISLPVKKKELSSIITEVYNTVQKHFKTNTFQDAKLTFTQLVPSDKKEDKVLTFIPLLHLETQRKLDMLQKQHLAEILISLTKKTKITA